MSREFRATLIVLVLLALAILLQPRIESARHDVTFSRTNELGVSISARISPVMNSWSNAVVMLSVSNGTSDGLPFTENNACEGLLGFMARLSYPNGRVVEMTPFGRQKFLGENILSTGGWGFATGEWGVVEMNLSHYFVVTNTGPYILAFSWSSHCNHVTNSLYPQNIWPKEVWHYPTNVPAWRPLTYVEITNIALSVRSLTEIEWHPPYMFPSAEESEIYARATHRLPYRTHH